MTNWTTDTGTNKTDVARRLRRWRTRLYWWLVYALAAALDR